MRKPRTAAYTTQAQDEVQLSYTEQHGQQAGQRLHVFYATSDYRRRQQQHGQALYPPPV